jgi:hypothetical protein
LKRHRSAASRAIVLKLGRTVETDDLYSRAEFRDDRTAGRRAVTIRSAVDGAFLFSKLCSSAAVAPIDVKLGRTVATDHLYSRAKLCDDRIAGRRAVAISSWR